MSIQIFILLSLTYISGCQALLNISLNNATRRRNLNCATNSMSQNDTGCELCIIEFYNNGSTVEGSSLFQHECAHQSNSFRRISQRCNGFSNITDIGYGICSPLSYETFDIHILCICATDFCNINLTNCRQSVTQQLESSTGPPALLPTVYYDLTKTISCSQATISSSGSFILCSTENSPFIDMTLCQEYFSDTTVLCEYSFNGLNASVSLRGWSIENFRYELDDVINQIQQQKLLSNSSTYYNDTSTTFYVSIELFDSENRTYIRERCFCTTDNCNANLTLCLQIQSPPIVIGRRKLNKIELNTHHCLFVGNAHRFRFDCYFSSVLLLMLHIYMII